jgi:hypothetical protein
MRAASSPGPTCVRQPKLFAQQPLQNQLALQLGEKPNALFVLVEKFLFELKLQIGVSQGKTTSRTIFGFFGLTLRFPVPIVNHRRVKLFADCLYPDRDILGLNRRRQARQPRPPP